VHDCSGQPADRWDALFADLEGQWEAAEQAEVAAEIDERTRDAQFRAPLLARVRAARGRDLALGVTALGAVHATIRDCGPDWILVVPALAGPVLIPTAALLWIGDPGPQAVPEDLEGQVARRWTLRLALRGLVESRQEVRLVLTDSTALEGTLQRVGADYVEIGLHPRGERPRPGSLTGARLVPVSALAAVRT
jgi:hypothetical protein